MVDTPASEPPAKREGPSPAAAARESRLAGALRANLRRRKAAFKAAAKPAVGEED
jgi:hypothetical protein